MYSLFRWNGWLRRYRFIGFVEKDIGLNRAKWLYGVPKRIPVALVKSTNIAENGLKLN